MWDINKNLSVYFIAGTQNVPSGSLPSLLEEALQAGITCFQYREKGNGSLTDQKDKTEMAKICQKLCKKYAVPFIVNDDVELALAIDADGIHVGQTDQAIQKVLTQFPNKIVGLSCYDEEQIQSANQLKELTYYGIGPVYGTQSKQDAEPPIGTQKLCQLTKMAKKPVVAIGGIALENVAAVRETNVAGVAVISAITQAENIRFAIEKIEK